MNLSTRADREETDFPNTCSAGRQLNMKKRTKRVMQHMQMGKESMAQCPMMQGMAGMKGMDEKSGDAPPMQK